MKLSKIKLEGILLVMGILSTVAFFILNEAEQEFLASSSMFFATICYLFSAITYVIGITDEENNKLNNIKSKENDR